MRACFLAGVLAFAPAVAFGQGMLLPMTGAGGKAKAAAGGGGGGFTGYADSFSAPLACWGFTACSTAIANANTAAINWNCTNGGAQSGTLHVDSTGGLNSSDISSMNTACGVQTIEVQLVNQLNPGTFDLNNTAGSRPTYTASAVNSLPCATFNGSSQGLAANVTSLTAQPYTVSALAKRTGGTSSEGDIFDAFASNAGTIFGFLNSANTVFSYAGTVRSATASDSNPHSFQTVFDNGGTSYLDVDSGATSISSPGVATPQAAGVTIGSSNGAGTTPSTNWLQGVICRVAVWGSAANGTQLGNLHTNDVTTYGTP